MDSRHGSAQPHAPSAVRAAEYVRMSTEHQQYSTENQQAAIRKYAVQHDITIVRTYQGAGKSGLRLSGRDALQQLLGDVQTGQADFNAILVYDVSRWGRFQDADESAYYNRAQDYLRCREGRLCRWQRPEGHESHRPTGNFDAVIVARNSFEKLPVSDETFKRFVDKQVDQLEEAILEAKAPGRKKRVRRVEGRRLDVEWLIPGAKIRNKI